MLNTPALQHILYKDGHLAYREAGEGPVLFLLHGMNGNSESWANTFVALSPSFRVVAWDAPSFGESDMFGDSLDDYVDAAKALMRALDLKDSVVIGHSMGGLVATQLAATPDCSVAGLVLSSTHLGFARPQGEALLPRYATRIDHIEAEGADTAYCIERAKRSTPAGTPNSVIRFLAAIASNARAEGIRDGGRMSQEADNTKLGAKVTAPVIILSGGKDKVISPEMHSALLAAFPQAEQALFPRAGHASFAEYPERFNELISQFAQKALA